METKYYVIERHFNDDKNSFQAMKIHNLKNVNTPFELPIGDRASSMDEAISIINEDKKKPMEIHRTIHEIA